MTARWSYTRKKIASAAINEAGDACLCEDSGHVGVQILPAQGTKEAKLADVGDSLKWADKQIGKPYGDTAEYGARADKAKPTVVYVSGPMTGIEDHNYPAFHDAAYKLRELGYEVVNPAENFDGRTDLDAEVYLRQDVLQMADKCNAVFFLEGWQNSAGARLEYNVAKSLGFEFLQRHLLGGNFPLGGDHVEPVELEASRIVRNGERQAVYGHPSQDFNRTSGMWSSYLGHPVTPEDVANMMTMLKLSRLKGTPGHRDSIVDAIGYQICNSRLKEDS